MDEQSKFKEALASVTIRAEENGGKLSAEEAKELLKDMEFNDEQMSMIYADRQKRRCRNCFQLPWQENRKRSVC